jgi:hypothetical protein
MKLKHKIALQKTAAKFSSNDAMYKAAMRGLRWLRANPNATVRDAPRHLREKVALAQLLQEA